jgi:protein-S-isoprenylcysteine O-methyltransferase Ste14
MRTRTALQGLAFVAIFFFLLPRAFVALNERAGWPRWESALADALGALLIAAGLGVFLYSSHLFTHLVRGTPVPIEPPSELVTSGLYRHSRNPIYVADVTVLVGVFCVAGHLALLLYPAILWLLIHAWVVWQEEPVLLRRFGTEYEAYRRRVPRWIGRRADR